MVQKEDLIFSYYQNGYVNTSNLHNLNFSKRFTIHTTIQNLECCQLKNYFLRITGHLKIY